MPQLLKTDSVRMSLVQMSFSWIVGRGKASGMYKTHPCFLDTHILDTTISVVRGCFVVFVLANPH